MNLPHSIVMTGIVQPLRCIIACLLSLLPLKSFAQHSAYLPVQGDYIVTPSYTFQTADQFWLGNVHYALADFGIAGNLQQHTFTLATEYGLTRNLALDVTLGYTRVTLPAMNQDGMTDSSLGIRYQFLHEHRTRPSRPTLALRVGAIVQGTYDLHLGMPPTHPGDGASGFETELLFGKRLGNSGLTLFGTTGYRNRSEHVPDDWFGTLGLHLAPEHWSWLGIHAAYRHEQSLGGVDLFGSSFTGNWQQAKEINRLIEAGLTFTPAKGPSITVFGSRNISGRNTPDKALLGIYCTWTFSGRVSRANP